MTSPARLVVVLCVALFACHGGAAPDHQGADDPAHGDGDGDGDGGDGDGDGDGDGEMCPSSDPVSGSGDEAGSVDALLPKPRSVELAEGAFALTAEAIIVAEGAGARAAADILAERLSRGTGYDLRVFSDGDAECLAGRPRIVLALDEATEPEAYTLEVASDAITLTGSAAGLSRGIETLRQLLPSAIEREASEQRARWLIPALRIEDAPRFRYRGMHLDVSRHFFTPAFVKHYIDLLAAYKLNTLHLHLTDDQGWRIEIQKYPKLTEVGAFRDEGGTHYGGFYTQDDIRDIVAHAAARGVEVIAEIEMPGHATAALAAYPEYGCTGSAPIVATTWGIFHNLFCPTEETFGFIEDVFEEVFALFPSTRIHIGGDEAPKDQWQASATAQAVMSREGLANEEELQAYFVRRVQQIAERHGRTIIGWDEIAADGVPTSATIMAWRGEANGKDAAERGHDVIMTPTSAAYFDHYQAGPAGEPKAFDGVINVATVYGFSPLPAGISAAGAAHILGAQGNLWSEYIPTESHAEYMLLPRAIALAEVLWSEPDTRDYADFIRRLIAHVPHLDAQGVNYGHHALVPPVEQAPYGEVKAIPGIIHVEDYDVGGEGIAYHDSAGGNQGGAYRTDDVDIENLTGGGRNVGYIAAGEWLEFSVEVATTAAYRVKLHAAAPSAGAAVHLEIDGEAVTSSIAIAPTLDWTTFGTTTGPSVTLHAGPHVLRVVFETGGMNLDWLQLD